MSFTADSISDKKADALSTGSDSSVTSLSSVSSRGSDGSNPITHRAQGKNKSKDNPYSTNFEKGAIPIKNPRQKSSPLPFNIKEKISKAIIKKPDDDLEPQPILKANSSIATLNSDDETSDNLAGKNNKGCGIRYNSSCRPRYSYPLESINWTKCNMKNWYKPNSRQYNKYKVYCKSTKKRNYSKNISVGVKMMHKKMPYIWRFLNKQTQKKMIKLANLPIDLININPNSKNPNYKKKMTTIKNILNK